MFPIAPVKREPPTLCAPKTRALRGGICLSGVTAHPPESKCSETFVRVKSVLLSISRMQDLGVLTLLRASATAVMASATPFTSVMTSMNPMPRTLRSALAGVVGRRLDIGLTAGGDRYLIREDETAVGIGPLGDGAGQ